METGAGASQERAHILAEAAKLLFSSLDIDSTLREVARLVVPRLADWCAIYTLEEDGGLLARAILHADPGQAWAREAFETVFRPRITDQHGIGRVARTGETRVTLDFHPVLASHLQPELRALAERLQVRSAMVVPLSAFGRVEGALALLHTTSGRRYREEDVPMAQQLAHRVAVAVESARFADRERAARATLERSLDRLARLQALTARLAAPGSLAETSRRIARECSLALRAAAAAVLVEDEERGLRVAHAHGAASPPAPGAGDAVAALVPQEGARPLPPEASEAIFPEARFGTVLLVPLRRQGVRVGALVVAWRDAGPSVAEDQSFLETVAEQAAQGLDRARLEDTILFQKALLEAQNEAALDGIFFQDANGRAAFYNRRLLEMFGVSEDVPNMATLEERLAAVIGLFEDPEQFGQVVMRLERERDAQHRQDLRLRDGRVLDCYTAPVKDADGVYRGRVWFYRDITDSRRIEEELVLARRQLAHGEKLAALGSLVSGVAHEVRTPLVYISNHAHVLKALAARTKLGGPQDAARLAEATEAICEGVDRINHLVQDLRRFTRLEAEAREPAALDDVVEAAARLFLATHRGRVRLETRLASAAVVVANRVQIQQVVLNLAENATDAAPAGSVVRISTRREQGHAVLEVHDDGSGIPREVQERMYEPFFTTKKEGSGLGLSIVERIVTQHGGRITVDSAPGAGTTFAVLLPLAPEP